MKDTKIVDFAKEFDACSTGVHWAKKNCPSGMMSEAYEKLLSNADGKNAETDYLFWVFTRAFDDKTLRLFAVRCVRETPLADGRTVFDLLTDERSVNAVVVAEKFALGLASQEELAAAREAAWDAAWAARDAMDAAMDAARAAARDARDAARDAAWDAARAARDAQRKMISDFGNPFKD